MKGRRMEEWKYHHRHQIDFSKDKKENKKYMGRQCYWYYHTLQVIINGRWDWTTELQGLAIWVTKSKFSLLLKWFWQRYWPKKFIHWPKSMREVDLIGCHLSTSIPMLTFSDLDPYLTVKNWYFLGIFNGISKIWMDLERWTKQRTRKVRIKLTFCDLRVDLLAFTNINVEKCIFFTSMTAFSPIISPYGKANHFSPSEWKFKLKIYIKSAKWGQFKVNIKSDMIYKGSIQVFDVDSKSLTRWFWTKLMLC